MINQLRRRTPAHLPRAVRVVAGTIAAGVLAACHIPTDVPILESRWVVPAEETSFGVADLLPGDVTLTADSSAFLVNFDPITFSETLGNLCPVCVAANGLNVPKPLFTGNFASAIGFPPEVSSVTIIDGQVQLSINNGLNFDPIRPSASARGSITIVLTDSADGDILGTLTIDGNTTAMPAGATLLRTIDLNAATINARSPRPPRSTRRWVTTSRSTRAWVSR